MDGDVQVRQGDLFFERIKELPKGLKKREDRILAHGEVTGHCHQINEIDFKNVDIFVDENGDLFLQTKKGKSFTVDHDEHDAITFDEGIFKMSRQREYDPIAEGRERRVVD